MSEEYINKYVAEKRFHDFIEGFPANSRFLLLDDFETSFNLSTPDRKDRKISEKQVTLSPIDIATRRSISQKDIR